MYVYKSICTFILQSRRSKTNAEARVITLALCINYVLTWWPGQERPAHLELKCSNTTLVCTFKCNTANKQCLLWFLPSLWQALTIGQRLVQIPMTGFPHIFDFNMYVQYAAEVPAVLSCQRLHFLCATAVRNWVFHAWPMFCCRYWVMRSPHWKHTYSSFVYVFVLLSDPRAGVSEATLRCGVCGNWYAGWHQEQQLQWAVCSRRLHRIRRAGPQSRLHHSR